MIAQDSNSFECRKERSRGRLNFTQMWVRIQLMREKVIARRFEFTWMRELVVASDDSNSLKCGWVIAWKIQISSNAGERSRGRFECGRVIALEIRICLNVREIDRAGEKKWSEFGLILCLLGLLFVQVPQYHWYLRKKFSIDLISSRMTEGVRRPQEKIVKNGGRSLVAGADG